jgi:hypothetical protein
MSGDEPLRLGTVDLVRQLQTSGWEVWIYTTSFRDPARVCRWLGHYGVDVHSVINGDIHRAKCSHVASNSRAPSKYPPAFGIDLHVDDSIGVKIEGETFGFDVVQVSPDDTNWAATVSATASTYASRRNTHTMHART